MSEKQDHFNAPNDNIVPFLRATAGGEDVVIDLRESLRAGAIEREAYSIYELALDVSGDDCARALETCRRAVELLAEEALRETADRILGPSTYTPPPEPTEAA